MSRGLHSLAVRNFGMLGEVSVPLRRLNVLVGPNGSGKSTLLGVVQFLGDAARVGLDQAVRQRGGVGQIRTRPAPGTPARSRFGPITVDVKAELTTLAHSGALDEYGLRLRAVSFRSRAPDGGPVEGFRHDESFRFKRTPTRGRRITLKGGKWHVLDEGSKERQLSLDKDAFGLAVLPQLGAAQGAAEIRKIQELFTTFRVFEIDVAAARRPLERADWSRLRSDASNLAAFLSFLHTEHSSVFDSLLVDAREMIPGLVELQFRSVGGPSDAMTVDVVDHGRAGATPLAHASFGTVRALALLAMLYDPSPPLLTCVEEIDHGLHPHLFDRLVDLLRKASARTQFLIATHSPALVNRLDPSELIVCERDADTGLARIPAVDAAAIAKIHSAGDYGLGELWFSGSLGGVPR